jgi:NADH-quinone oxidoreductase subunit M
MQKAFFADAGHAPAEPHASDSSHAPLPPITLPERIGAIILIVASVIVGLYPQILLNIIVPALNSPLFNGLRQGGWR